MFCVCEYASVYCVCTMHMQMHSTLSNRHSTYDLHLWTSFIWCDSIFFSKQTTLYISNILIFSFTILFAIWWHIDYKFEILDPSIFHSVNSMLVVIGIFVALTLNAFSPDIDLVWQVQRRYNAIHNKMVLAVQKL